VSDTKTFRITVRGSLSGRFVSGFSRTTLEQGEGTTTLVSEVTEDELTSLLERVQNLGLELVEVEVEVEKG
jgi:hypothetical protein